MERLMSAIEEIHLVELEQGWDDDVKCASEHRDHRNSVCTKTVTHRAFTCVIHGVLVCQAHANFYASAVARGARCTDCRQPVESHWKAIEA